MDSGRAQVIATKLLENGPDDFDPRTALNSLPGKPWITSFIAVIDPYGQPETQKSVDYPVIAVSREDAEQMSKRELTQAGYDMRRAIAFDAWITDDETFRDLQQVWTDRTAEDVAAGKYGPK